MLAILFAEVCHKNLMSLQRATVSSENLVLKTHLVAGAIALVTLTVFYVSPNLQVFDSNYSILLSEVILRGRSVDLSRVPLRNPQADPPSLGRDGYTYHTIVAKGRRLYYMPWGGSILALPAVALLNLAGMSALTPTWHFDLAGECEIQKVLAALLMAILTCLIFYTALLEELPLSWAAVIALGTAFGTQLWSTASRALWEQTWLLLLLGVAILLLAGIFILTAKMSVARFDHTGNALPGGKVLIAGGFDTQTTITNTAELY
ncbi:MAG TPA: kelch repeat-containing protein, partial [Candidatus Binataceae bacterium]|nr:kelch repeat-containing protein [Candidatus Binataceae bacterium]